MSRSNILQHSHCVIIKSTDVHNQFNVFVISVNLMGLHHDYRHQMIVKHIFINYSYISSTKVCEHC